MSQSQITQPGTHVAPARPARRSRKTGTLMRLLPHVGRVASTLAPGLTALALADLFTRTRRSEMPEYERDWLRAAGATRLRLADGAVVPLYEWRATPRGFGVIDEAPLPTVLLVHGMSGRGTQLAGFAAPLVAAGLRVLAFDAPGHGAAEGRRSSLPDLARVVQQVGAAVGPLAGIVAHSNGAAATTVALDRGLKADRVVLLAPPEDLRAYMAGLAAQLGIGAAVVSAVQARLERRYGMAFEDLRGSTLARRRVQPALILHDRDDAVVGVADGRRLAANWPGARLQLTEGLGHNRILRDAEVQKQAVDFLTGAG